MTDEGHDAEMMNKDIQSKEELEEELEEKQTVDVENDESRNSTSDTRGNDAAAAVVATTTTSSSTTTTTSSSSSSSSSSAAGYNPQILRRPSKQHHTASTVDQSSSNEDCPLPVQVKVELDVGFQPGIPIPDLPHPSLDSSFKSETFDEIRRLIRIMDDHFTTHQSHDDQHVQDVVQVNEEIEDLLSTSEDEESDDEGQGLEGQGLKGQGLFAVDSLKFFLKNIRFDDVTMT